MQVNIETEPDTSIPTVTLHVPVDYPETAALTAALKNLSIEAATLTVSQRTVTAYFDPIHRSNWSPGRRPYAG